MASMYARKLEHEHIEGRQQERRQKEQVQVKVEKKRWVTRGEKVLYTVFVGFLVVASVLIVSYSSTLDSVNRDIQDLEKQVQQQEERNGMLTAEVKALSEPSRIINIAKEHGLNIKNGQVELAKIR
ncbi:cell division protein FtsL [Salirhabdus salicampi]|uniref:cell division protein FtsL n=1 Tax=Salirhabdus salicampi TaxID=476102 RepID=UPI0020C4C6E5|nr:cell division protein FtsL [Salirhabdus salicampi]MCP8616610.1 cell division protein FtsL [Salirhabdus salicampi]